MGSITPMPEQELIPNSLSLSFVEALYNEFLRDPSSVDPEWRQYFETQPRLDGGATVQGPSFRPPTVWETRPPRETNGHAAEANGHAAREANGVHAAEVITSRTVKAKGAPASAEYPPPGSRREMEAIVRQDRVDQLIRAYRVRGHMVAQIDPLGIREEEQPELDPAFYGLTDEDLDRQFSTASMAGAQVRTLREIIDCLRGTYCRMIGVQFMHIDDLNVRCWLQERMESSQNRVAITRQEQLRILTRLTDAVIFEEFIQKKFIGAKSFSLQGSESLIPLLDLAIEYAGERGVTEVVLAMAHRGRLNVLANIMGKSPQRIFREFEDVDPELHHGGGDVKYHLGFSTDWTTGSGKNVHISLCFNPSHLAYVSPVALGRLRAKQDRCKDYLGDRGMGIIIHGDAAFAGQGVTQETLNLSQLRGYHVGGTIHIVVNNQIGFTTSPSDARSSMYATDAAKLLQVPIFHVNGEDPEAVAQVVQLALDFRTTFKRDVIIDMYGYRRFGHNEGDEPGFTQPLLYQAIAARKSVREGYLEHLLRLGEITREEADRIAGERRQNLEAELAVARSDLYTPLTTNPSKIWKRYVGGPEQNSPDVPTGVERARLSELLEAQTRLPEDFRPHPKIERALKQRAEMARGERGLDWAAAEALALASLATEGYRIRMSGQDCERGTFSHRHAVLHDYRDGHTYCPLRNLSPDQAPIEIFNSPLCETGVLGFEYGYSLDWPDGLVVWEAQFGDFANAAQVIIDQFIVSAEDKWKRLSGLVLLLPHGFEGQGPEHSSARLERFLVLAAEDNIQVVYPTTPAQYFHMLRRQVLRTWRKPLVVMTPKSLLRHPEATSPLDELATGQFHRVLSDSHDRPGEAIARVLLCSGKLYYELEKERRDMERHDVAILRLEQLYPLPTAELEEALSQFKEGTPVYWVQEEPENMGAWRYLRVHLGDRLFNRLPLAGICRAASASPATGSKNSHVLEQRAILDAAFGGIEKIYVG